MLTSGNIPQTGAVKLEDDSDMAVHTVFQTYVQSDVLIPTRLILTSLSAPLADRNCREKRGEKEKADEFFLFTLGLISYNNERES